MDTLNGLLGAFGQQLLQLLPVSPFAAFFADFGAGGYPNLSLFFGWLNWFVPVNSMFTLFSAWLSCVALYYLYSIIMRWIKVIG